MKAYHTKLCKENVQNSDHYLPSKKISKKWNGRESHYLWQENTENYLFKLSWLVFNIYSHPNYLSKLVSSLTGCCYKCKITYDSTVFLTLGQDCAVIFLKIHSTIRVTSDKLLIPLGLLPQPVKCGKEVYLTVFL